MTIAGHGGVPANATAVVMNLTATHTSTASYVTAYPAGISRPVASNLNFVAGQTEPNLVIVGLGTNGAVSLFNDAGNAELIADVVGYYAAPIA